MLPDNVVMREGWTDFADAFMEYVEECSTAMAGQLERAQRNQDVIEPTDASDEYNTAAEATYNVSRETLNETDGNMLIKSLRSTKNVYEIWRLRWLNYAPSSDAVDGCSPALTQAQENP